MQPPRVAAGIDGGYAMVRFLQTSSFPQGGQDQADTDRRVRRGHVARALRRMARHPPSDAEVARLVAEFHARGGVVTRCAAACLQPIRNGAGLDVAAGAAVLMEQALGAR
jgi:hypothetical protein